MSNHDLCIYICDRGNAQLDFYDKLLQIADTVGDSVTDQEYRRSLINVDHYVSAAKIANDHC